MRPANCLRLARQSRLLHATASSTQTTQVRVLRLRCTPTSQWQAKSFTSSPTLASRFREAAEEEHVSPFRQQRQDDLRADQQSEDPLYPDAHPRLPDFTDRKSVPEFLEDFHEKLVDRPVTLTGRIRSKRVVGKNLIFVDIVNEFQKAQVMISKAKCELVKAGSTHKFALFKSLIQVGDHISVTGVATRTSAGEPTLEARQLPELLAPTMEQVPEKLTDPKTRMQDRHVDMLVNKETLDVLRLRSEIMKHLRDHFHSKRFMECQTPILAENAGGAIARPFVTKATEFQDKDLALRIAPELWLKRLVVGGIDKVFEIGPSFRNEGIDATHNPEFTTCEFYSAYTNLAGLITETEELMHSLATHSQSLISTQLTSLPPLDLPRFVGPYKQIEFVPGLEQALGIRFPKLTAEDALPELIAVLKLAGKSVPGEQPRSLAKLLDRLATLYLEPKSVKEPVFITNHPVCMSPLAKSFLCPRTYQLVSARAELFVGGRELANMYEEENDPKEQKRKLMAHRNLVNKDNGDIGFAEGFVEEEEVEKPLVEDSMDDQEPQPVQEVIEDDDDGDAAPLDESFVRALDYGLPPTGGWGCGVERLVMLFSGASRISDCLSFGTLRNVVSLSKEEEKKAKS